MGQGLSIHHPFSIKNELQNMFNLLARYSVEVSSPF